MDGCGVSTGGRRGGRVTKCDRLEYWETIELEVLTFGCVTRNTQLGIMQRTRPAYAAVLLSEARFLALITPHCYAYSIKCGQIAAHFVAWSVLRSVERDREPCNAVLLPNYFGQTCFMRKICKRLFNSTLLYDDLQCFDAVGWVSGRASGP